MLEFQDFLDLFSNKDKNIVFLQLLLINNQILLRKLIVLSNLLRLFYTLLNNIKKLILVVNNFQIGGFCLQIEDKILQFGKMLLVQVKNKEGKQLKMVESVLFLHGICGFLREYWEVGCELLFGHCEKYIRRVINFQRCSFQKQW